MSDDVKVESVSAFITATKNKFSDMNITLNSNGEKNLNDAANGFGNHIARVTVNALDKAGLRIQSMGDNVEFRPNLLQRFRVVSQDFGKDIEESSNSALASQVNQFILSNMQNTNYEN